MLRGELEAEHSHSSLGTSLFCAPAMRSVSADHIRGPQAQGQICCLESHFLILFYLQTKGGTWHQILVKNTGSDLITNNQNLEKLLVKTMGSIRKKYLKMVFKAFLAFEFLQSREPELGSEIGVVQDVGP